MRGRGRKGGRGRGREGGWEGWRERGRGGVERRREREREKWSKRRKKERKEWERAIFTGVCAHVHVYTCTVHVLHAMCMHACMGVHIYDCMCTHSIIAAKVVPRTQCTYVCSSIRTFIQRALVHI